MSILDVQSYLKDQYAMTTFNELGYINAFPGYEFVEGKNMYRGDDIGKGGYVYAEPGVYGNVALLDVASMHPNSAINLNAFGDFTVHYKDILDARIAIKRGEFEKARHLFGGRLAPYLDDESSAAALAQALKIAINSVYGLTSANFTNPFRDVRNKNNIVALRGALFMRTLQDEIKKRGFKVAHIKTDSIKIPDATPEIIQFVMEFGELYGYEFEHEATYDRMCLVNDAVYIAKYSSAEDCEKQYGYIPGDNKKKPGKWTATGTQFQIPYVFKKLFSKEPLEFKDLCETKSVTSSLYLDMNEEILMEHGDGRLKELEKRLTKMSKDETVSEEEIDEIKKEIEFYHRYRFIGKVGSFCPIKPGCGGGLLCREKDGKFYSATGAKGYRWMEAEMVEKLNKFEDIDEGHFIELANTAIDAIKLYGDYEWFVSDDPYIGPTMIEGEYGLHPLYDEDLPFYYNPEKGSTDFYVPSEIPF